MPLKRGKSHQVISSNIREMVSAGHKPKVAVAAALAHAHKYAEGGEVEEDGDEFESLPELNKMASPEHQSIEMKLAQALAEGGMVEDFSGESEPTIDDPVEVSEPPMEMSKEVSEQAREALIKKKKSRRY